MWEATVKGRPLHFHLVGLNNRNFIMADEETGTWWQQVTGKAILGPLKGEQLKLVPSEMLSFGTWKQEASEGRVLRPDTRDEKWREFADDFEREMAEAKAHASGKQSEDNGPARTDVVAGVEVNGAAKAYPLSALEQQSPILDTLGGVRLMVVLSDDRKSVRAFETTVDGQNLEFFAKADAKPMTLVDQQTGSEWDFSGRCIKGQFKEYQLKKVDVLTEYFFDWKNYHPETSLYQLKQE